jgi:hypothetical protein
MRCCRRRGTVVLIHAQNYRVAENSVRLRAGWVLRRGGTVAAAILIMIYAVPAQPLPSLDAASLDGKVIVGYQGWFGCPGDKAETPAWRHWLNPDGSLAVDMLPDVSELPEDPRCRAPFLRHADGSAVPLFSSRDPGSVERHFEWLRQFDIHGAALQRFVKGLDDRRLHNEMDQVLINVRSAAEANGRVFFVMYDISGATESDWARALQQDWQRLTEELRVTKSKSYLHHKGKPVVGIWGLGFADRPATPDAALSVLDFFHRTAAEDLQASVIGGVPAHWRQQSMPTADGHSWREVYTRLDAISPWSVHAYTNDTDAARFASTVMRQDIHFTAAAQITYMPVVFPGFSNRNLRGGRTQLDAIPRECGRFMRSQIANALNEGAGTLYVAMFDELNEGTAIMKIAPHTSDIPPGAQLLASDQGGCLEPNDLYLRITGEAAKSLSTRR